MRKEWAAEAAQEKLGNVTSLKSSVVTARELASSRPAWIRILAYSVATELILPVSTCGNGIG